MYIIPMHFSNNFSFDDAFFFFEKIDIFLSSHFSFFCMTNVVLSFQKSITNP